MLNFLYLSYKIHYMLSWFPQGKFLKGFYFCGTRKMGLSVECQRPRLRVFCENKKLGVLSAAFDLS